jgi:hypothetical protein
MLRIYKTLHWTASRALSDFDKEQIPTSKSAIVVSIIVGSPNIWIASSCQTKLHKKASQYKASQRESFSARKLLKVSEKASQRPKSLSARKLLKDQKASQRESFSNKSFSTRNLFCCCSYLQYCSYAVSLSANSFQQLHPGTRKTPTSHNPSRICFFPLLPRK